MDSRFQPVQLRSPMVEEDQRTRDREDPSALMEGSD